jgi:hypothetical protein
LPPRQRQLLPLSEDSMPRVSADRDDMPLG